MPWFCDIFVQLILFSFVSKCNIDSIKKVIPANVENVTWVKLNTSRRKTAKVFIYRVVTPAHQKRLKRLHEEAFQLLAALKKENDLFS